MLALALDHYVFTLVIANALALVIALLVAGEEFE